MQNAFSDKLTNVITFLWYNQPLPVNYGMLRVCGGVCVFL